MRKRGNILPSSIPKNDPPKSFQKNRLSLPITYRQTSIFVFVVLAFSSVQHWAGEKEVIIVDSKLLRKSGQTWKTVDWKDNAMIKSSDTAFNFTCRWANFTSAQSKREAQMCVHPTTDIVSDNVVKDGHWADCDALSAYWNKNVDDVTESVYVEIGANIGACTMEMLLGTNATIIAFEPHPINLFALKQTISKLDSSIQNRLTLVPVGLGLEHATSTIFSANDNMGNSIIGTIIKDHDKQEFDKKLQFQVPVERLDSILNSGLSVKLMKMDAQGFECNILEGMGQAIASKIETIKFEYAYDYLEAQNCTDMIDRLRNYGFDIYRTSEEAGEFGKPVTAPPERGVFDLYANRQKAK